MALITYSSPVQRISGRLAKNDTTYTHNNGANVLRAQPEPANPQTDDQQQIRAVFSLVTKQWKALTQANRDAWVTWSKAHDVKNRLGVSVSRNGISAYVQLASMHYVDTAALLAAAPVLAQPSGLTGIDSLVTQDGDNQLRFQVTHGYSTLTGLYLVTRATAAISFESQTPQLADYRLIQGVDTTSIIALPASGSNAVFTATRYPYQDGQWVGIECTIMNAEGWQSEPFRVFQNYLM